MPKTNKLIDLTGCKFGRLTVLYRIPSKDSEGALWYCFCECGNYKEIKSTNLRYGHTKTCGCYNRYDLTGQKFNKLTVIGKSENKNIKIETKKKTTP